MFDLVLRGGSVIDGTGKPAFPADVALRGDRIAAVSTERIPADAAARSLDVSGRTVAPGFIDVHNHTDGWLLREPNFASKTLQGITTEVLMSDGISYAPTSPEDAPRWIQYLRALNGLQLEDYRGWQSLDDYFNLLDGRTAQNVVAQIPYANLRVIASGWGCRRLDDVQINMMRRLVETGMDSGAVGVSTGLDYVNQFYASTDELVEVLSAMGSPHRAQAGLYVTHIRYKKGLLPALKESVEIARRAGVKLHVSHLKAETAELAAEVIEYLDNTAAHEVDFSFDVYPYMPGSTMLHSLLPNDVWDDGPGGVTAKLTSPAVRRRFAILLETTSRNAVDRIRIAWVQSKANARYQGQTLADYIAATGKPPADALCDLLLEENLAVLGVFHVGDDLLVEPFLKHPKYMLGSDGIYQPDGPVHPRQFGSTARILGPLVRDRKWFTLEEAVQKMTSIPAARFGLTDRGVVREGAFADLTVFDPATIADRGKFGDSRHAPVGIDHVIVNGTAVVENATTIEKLNAWPGRWLKYEPRS